MLFYTSFLTSSLSNVLQQDGLSVDAMRQETCCPSVIEIYLHATLMISTFDIWRVNDEALHFLT